MRRQQILDVIASGAADATFIDRGAVMLILAAHPETQPTKDLDAFNANIKLAERRIIAMTVAFVVTIAEAARCDTADGGDAIDTETMATLLGDVGTMMSRMVHRVQKAVDGPSFTDEVMDAVAAIMNKRRMEGEPEATGESLLALMSTMGARRSWEHGPMPLLASLMDLFRRVRDDVTEGPEGAPEPTDAAPAAEGEATPPPPAPGDAEKAPNATPTATSFAPDLDGAAVRSAN